MVGQVNPVTQTCTMPDCRNTTREPSGATVNARGALSVNRWVRACRRGKESASVVMPRPYWPCAPL